VAVRFLSGAQRGTLGGFPPSDSTPRRVTPLTPLLSQTLHYCFQNCVGHSATSTSYSI